MTFLRRVSREDVLAIGGLWCLVLVIFLPTLLHPFSLPGGSATSPTDDIVIFYSWESLLRQAYSGGEWPLWNPYFGAGTPLLANPQSASIYPMTAIFRKLSIPASFTWNFIFHVGVLATGIYVLLRDLGTRTAPAVLGAASFALSGVMIARIGGSHPVVAYALAWPPWSLWAFRRLLATGKWLYVIPTSVFNALTILPGHLQFSMIFLLIPASYFVFFIIDARKDRKRLVVHTALALSVVVASLGLTAALLLPTIEALPFTLRSEEHFTLARSAGSAMNIANSGLFVIPFLLRSAIDATELGFGNFVEVTAYVGLLPLVLIATVLLTHRKYNQPIAFFFGGLIIVGLLLAWSGSPVYSLVYQLLPFFRAPIRFIALTAFGLSLLGALSLETLLTHYEDLSVNRWLLGGSVIVLGIVTAIWLVFGGRLTAMLQNRQLFAYVDSATFVQAQTYNLVRLFIVWSLVAVYLWIKDVVPLRMWGWIAVGIVVLDMAAFASIVVRTVDAHLFENDDHPLNRVHLSPTDLRLNQYGRMPPIYGMPTIQEHDPVRLAAYERIRQTGEAFGAEPTRGRALLSASYRYVEEGEQAPEGQPVFVGDGVMVYAESENIPRLYAAPAVEVVHDDEAAYSYVAYEAIEDIIARPVVTVTGSGPDLPSRPAPDAPPAVITMVAYEMQYVAVEVETEQPVLLVLNDMDYPGWEAQVDGEPVTIWKTNYTFRGVEVPVGTHLIEMTYESRPFRTGLTITLVTTLVLISGVAVSGLRGRMLKPRDAD